MIGCIAWLSAPETIFFFQASAGMESITSPQLDVKKHHVSPSTVPNSNENEIRTKYVRDTEVEMTELVDSSMVNSEGLLSGMDHVQSIALITSVSQTNYFVHVLLN